MAQRSIHRLTRPVTTGRYASPAFAPALWLALATSDAVAADALVRQLGLGLGFAMLLVALLTAALLQRNRQMKTNARALHLALAQDDPVLSALPDLVTLKDADGRYQSCNDAFTALLGRQRTDIIGKTDFDLFDTQVARRWRASHRGAIEAGRAIEDESWLSLPDQGFTALLLTTRKPLYDENGQLMGVLSIARDVTELRIAEDRARKQATYQRALLDNFPHLAWMKDADGRYLAVNQAFVDAAGRRDANDIVDKNDLDVWPHDLAEAYRADDRTVMRTRRNKEVEEAVRQSGELVWFETYKAPVISDNGELLGTVGFARDVSERRRMEQAIRDSERRFREFFQRHSAAMLVIDPGSGRIVDVNEAAIAFYGYPRTELVGMRIEQLNTLPPEEVETLRLQASEGERNYFEFRHRLASGEVRDVEVYSSIIEQNGQRVLLSVVHDITERKRSQEVLEREHDLFAAGPVVVLTLSPAGKWPISEVSENCASVLGYRSEELTGGGITGLDLVHPDDRDRVVGEASTYLEQGRNRFEQSLRLRLRDGSHGWFHVFTQVVRNAQQDVEAIRSYLVDQTSIKELEITLADERRRLSYVIEGMGVGTWEWNIQTGETRFNERWAELIGYRLSELQPVSIETWLRAAHPEDLKRSEVELRRHFAGESDQYVFEARMRHKDGHWVWVLDRGRVFEWTEDGRPLWMYGTHQDITERKLAEIKTRENEQRLRAAAVNAYDVLYEWDLASDRLDWFGDVDHLLGYSRGTLSGSSGAWLAYVHPEDREHLRVAADNRATATTPCECEYRIQHADGSYREWQDKAVPVLGADGQPDKWVGVCSDVTLRKEAERRLQLAASVFDNAHEGIIIADRNVRIVDVNAAFIEITGYQRDEALGRNPSFLSAGHHDKGFYGAMWQALQRDGHWRGEVVNRRKDGTEWRESLAITAVTDDSGAVVHYVGMFFDASACEGRRRAQH